MSNKYSIFTDYTCPEQYIADGVKYCVPMTAKELETEEEQDKCLNSADYYLEEKFDGTRATLHFMATKSFDFIPNKLGCLKHCLKYGSGFENGGIRIYKYYKEGHSISDFSDFLKYEFGVGGRTVTFPDKCRGSQDFSAKGMRIHHRSSNCSEEQYSYTWREVAKTTSEMLESGELYFQSAYTRCFSRRVSVKTDWFCENTDALPHLRDVCIPELEGTVIDGEMFIPNRPFKDVSSTLNCTWDKAVDRQEELGKIVFHAFDILYYKGIRVEMLPLKRRKELLRRVVEKAHSSYIEFVDYQQCGKSISTVPYESKHGNLSEVFNNLGEAKHSYPHFYNEMLKLGGNFHSLSPRAFYEYIVATGGEGVMVKPINGKYYHKRSWEFSKIKKFMTKDVVIIGFTEPTKEYKGKFPKDRWDYWCDKKGEIRLSVDKVKDLSAKELKASGRVPVSKFWFEDWIGTIRYGVIITPEEQSRLAKNKKFNIVPMKLEDGNTYNVLEVGECSGFDEEVRKLLSSDPNKFIGTTIEIGCNELFRDTGKMRHPRFIRFREDKSPIDCTWSVHIS